MKKILVFLAVPIATLAFFVQIVAPAPVHAQTPFCYTFTQNLGVGGYMSSSDGQALTADLASAGLWNANTPITTYTDAVASAVSGFQERYAAQILTPNGLSYGTGYLGASTRAELNNLYGCQSTNPTPTSQCPAGYICTPINQNPSPLVCPIGYVCSPINSNPTSITVTSPNGNETWVRGITEYITWTGGQGIGNINLEPPTPPCAQPGLLVRCMIVLQPLTIASGINLSSGSYAWSVGQISTGSDPDGQYKVQICPSNISNNAQCDDSNSSFTITSSNQTGQTPVISGGIFPTILGVGQTGTWTVNATNPQNSSLSYSVNWGDVQSGCIGGYYCPASTQVSGFSQSSSFTHSYSIAGTYTITFTVMNASGQSAQTSTTVQVGNVITGILQGHATATMMCPNPSTGRCNSPTDYTQFGVKIYQGNTLIQQTKLNSSASFTMNLQPGTYMMYPDYYVPGAVVTDTWSSNLPQQVTISQGNTTNFNFTINYVQY